MNGYARAALVAVSLLLLMTCGMGERLRADEPGPREIPPAFAPLEYLVGRWKGQGVPKENGANQFRGWTETHNWAWNFAGGKPSGLAVTIEGGKLLAKGKLSFDAARNRYRLEATEPKPSAEGIAFEGTLESGKVLVLERTGTGEASGKKTPKVRLSIRPNANFIRYTMTQDRREPGAFQYGRVIEVGVTREGESFAAGSSAVDRPRCIVTGGAAAMTVTDQGRTFPICCTGCRDEFYDNREKYIKKADLLLASERAKGRTNQPATSRVSRFEDAFAGDVVDSDSSITAAGQGETGSAASAKKASKVPIRSSAPGVEKNPKPKPAAKGVIAGAAAGKQAARAATLLRLGQNLEKAGKTTAALTYFRQIVKDLPNTPAAKTAAERINALNGSGAK
jgi:hypothetical protein